jgi:asparagine synthase (glutamine-hydrolysing)
MTALAGLWNQSDKPHADVSCAMMLSALRPYGPDDSALWNDGGVAFGRCLFRLLPEDDFDHGPIESRDGRYVLVADIRIDNRNELLATLEDSLPSRDLADSTLLLAAWEKWEEGALARIVGDFAFALWDKPLRRLTLVRDFLGQRPLYYHRGRDFVAFASMAKGLHALPGIPYAVDEERVAEFLVLMPAAGERSFFRGIERVEPGHVLTITPESVSARRYWSPEPKTVRLSSTASYVEALRERLDEAVRCRLRGRRRDLGTHLSGGLDSSAVTATAARLLAPTQKLFAFTAVPRAGQEIAVPEGHFTDEGPLAARTAALYPGIEHVLVRSDRRSPIADLDRTFYFYEEPILNLCNEGWFAAVNAAARDCNISVVLGGQLGNFTLSYDGMQALPDLLRNGRWSAWLDVARGLARGGHPGWRNLLGQSVGPLLPAGWWRWLRRQFGRGTNDIAIYSAIRGERLAALDLERRALDRGLDFRYAPRGDSFATRLWALGRVDLGNFSKGTLGASGIDLRDPLADRRLVEFCLAIPAEEFIRGGMPRALARSAMADRLPAEVLSERRRGLQGADWYEALTAARGEVEAELGAIGECAPAVAAIDLDRLTRLIRDWPPGGWHRRDIIHSYRYALLRGISAGHFLRRATRGNR